MRKLFIISKLENSDLKRSDLKDSQVIAYREDQSLHVQNMDIYPKQTALPITFDSRNGLVTIKFKLKNGEFLAIGSEQGVAPKSKIEPK